MSQNDKMTIRSSRREYIQQAIEFVKASGTDARKGFLLLGAPKTGKTWLIKQIEDEIKKDIPEESALRCVIVGKWHSHNDSVRWIDVLRTIEDCIGEFDKEGLFKDYYYRYKSANSLQKLEFFKKLTDQEEPISKITKNLVIVFIVDDIDSYLANDLIFDDNRISLDDLLDIVWSVSNVRIIGSSSANLDTTRIKNRHELLFPRFIWLKQLTEKEANDVIRRKIGRNIGNDLMNDILTYAGYHPFLLTELCDLLHQALKGEQELRHGISQYEECTSALEEWRERIRLFMDNFWKAKWNLGDERVFLDRKIVLNKLSRDIVSELTVAEEQIAYVLALYAIAIVIDTEKRQYSIPSSAMRSYFADKLSELERSQTGEPKAAPLGFRQVMKPLLLVWLAYFGWAGGMFTAFLWFLTSRENPILLGLAILALSLPFLYVIVVLGYIGIKRLIVINSRRKKSYA